jgi:hypothetical protein
MKKFILLVLFCQTVFSIPIVIDLTKLDSSGEISGAIFRQGSVDSGTGNYVDFVQIQHKTTEQGYNTSFRPNQFDEGSSLNFNRDVQLGELAVTTLDGSEYLIFGLDINEAQNEELLSLDRLQIFISSTGNRNGYPNLGTMIYNMDYSDSGNTVLLDSSLSHGSGTSDMMLYIPTNLLTDFSTSDYLYLYSSFGNFCDQWETSDGAEQWGIDNCYFPRYVPEPNSLIFLMIGLGMLGKTYSRRRKSLLVL